jgi:cytochrome c553
MGTPQTPPIGGSLVESWLAAGWYKLWSSEPAIHGARSPSPHGFDRVYSNDVINANATGTGAWPLGAAAVKELYGSLTDTTPVGYAVYLKTQANSAAGANWYFYERVPLSSTAPHDANGVVADGLGGTGTAMSICVACHAAAGSDAAHTPSVGGRDEVYTPVSTSPPDASAPDTSLAGTPQMPPMGGSLVEPWLAAGWYKLWDSEPAIHAARSPSPHGFDRVYSNEVINANATGTGAWPLGAAAVKELYGALTDTIPVGYAVYLKTQADSAAGANWYFYERVPLSSTAPHDANGVVADGLGATGTAMSICVACHAAAGSDAAHTPSVGGRDEVYTPVP